jgi:hypothetical protein
MLVSVAVVVAVKFGVSREVIAWPWFTVIGFATTMAMGVLFPSRPTPSSYRDASAPPR